MPNCRVVENTCDWFWPNKVCLEITTSIEATPEHPVRLLCNYEGLTKPSAPTKPSDTPGRQRKRKRVQRDETVEDDDAEYSGERSSGSDNDDTGVPDGPEPQEDEAEDWDAGGGEGDDGGQVIPDQTPTRAERAAARSRT